MAGQLSGRVASLLEALPSLRAEVSPDAAQAYGRDWTRQWTPAPSAVVFPATVEEVAALVGAANHHEVPLVPSGGRTGLSGGAVAAHGELVVSMERMRRVLAFSAEDRTLTVEAGLTTQRLQEAAAERGLHYPVDFGSRGSSHIGGNIATNAGGINVLRYGMTRAWVAGLKVVAGNGEVLELNRGLAKNNAGYDLQQLFIGSEGTLGLIVEATMRLASPPPPQQVMVLATQGMREAVGILARLRARLTLSAFEFFTGLALGHVVAAGQRDPFESRHPVYVLAEFDATPDGAMEAFNALLEEGLVHDGVLSASAAQAAALWALRERITESIAPRRPYKNDIAVRVASLPEFLARADALLRAEYPRLEVIWFGHLGDGNVHISVLPEPGMDGGEFVRRCEGVTRALADLLAEFGGTISAEHGIGLLKKPYLEGTRSRAEIELMRQVKRVFDPRAIMNPGKIF